MNKNKTKTVELTDNMVITNKWYMFDCSLLRSITRRMLFYEGEKKNARNDLKDYYIAESLVWEPDNTKKQYRDGMKMYRKLAKKYNLEYPT